MAEYVVQENSLVSVANAIRSKSGGTDSLVFPAGFVEAIEDIKSAESAAVTIHNDSSTEARFYFSKFDYATSDYRDVDAGTSTPAVTIGIPQTYLHSLVVVRCGASCTATATRGCSWVMNVSGTSYRVFAFLITSDTATITVTDT